MGWTLFFMLVILKIPLAAALYLVWYAIKQEPEPEESPGTEGREPWRKPPLLPRFPRRGPAGGAGCKPLPCPQLVDTQARRTPVYARRADY